LASRRGIQITWAFGLLFSAAFCPAQAPPQTGDAGLYAMWQQAAIIFTGQVTAIRRHSPGGGGTGLVEIDFAIDDAVLGASGPSYTLREWTGLWASGDPPFSVGQSFLMFLNSPSAAGFSSPVGGSDGAVPVRKFAQTSTSQASPKTAGTQLRLPGSSAQAATATVDLRWVETGNVRPVAYRQPSPAHTTTAWTMTQHASPVFAPRADSLAPEAATGLQIPANEISVAADAMPASASQGEPYANVIAMLRSWTEEDNAPR
jgi:hypothetical protein